MMENSKPNRVDTPTASQNVRRSYSHQFTYQERMFHEPKINKLKILQDQLEDVKLCAREDSEDIKELSLRTRELLIKSVSFHLNWEFECNNS